MIQLYQFPFSHFCEKARWALDYKGVPYRIVNLLPGFHQRTVRKLAPKTCLPLLCDNGTIVQESSAIIDYLDEKHPNPSLTPLSPQAAHEAREWERYLDQEIGVTLRLWSYYHRLPDQRLALRFLLQGSAWQKRPFFILAYPKVRRAMIQYMNINADTASQSERRLRAALDKLDKALESHSFLVGNCFSRADLTACSLLSRFCLPDGNEASALLPPASLRLRAELEGRPFHRWVLSIYEGYRAFPDGSKVRFEIACGDA
jgi:glutathione S-transferase